MALLLLQIRGNGSGSIIEGLLSCEVCIPGLCFGRGGETVAVAGISKQLLLDMCLYRTRPITRTEDADVTGISNSVHSSRSTDAIEEEDGHNSTLTLVTAWKVTGAGVGHAVAANADSQYVLASCLVPLKDLLLSRSAAGGATINMTAPIPELVLQPFRDQLSPIYSDSEVALLDIVDIESVFLACSTDSDSEDNLSIAQHRLQVRLVASESLF
jgi:hypothetical protein